MSQEVRGSADARKRRLDISIVGGVAWTAGAKWATQLFSWAALAITARLLAHADYGIGEEAGYVFALTNTLAEFGVGTAALHLTEMDDDALHQLHGFSLMLCTGVYLVAVLLSPLIARIFLNPVLVPVIAVTSLTFFITGFQAVPNGLLQRSMDYKKLSLAEGTLSLVQAAVMVTLAKMGYGYWALIWSAVAGKAANAAMLLWWKPFGFRFPKWKTIRPALNFGRNAAVGSLATTAYWHSDVLVVGRAMGASALGTYRMALFLANAPAEKISMLIMRTAGPLFANVQSDPALARRYFLLFADTISLLLMPAMTGLIMVGPDAVPALLGPGWEDSLKPLIWLASFMIVAVLGSLVTQVLTSRRMTAFTMKIALINLVVMPVALMLGAHFAGTTGVAAAWIIASPLTALPSAIVLLRRIDLTWREFLVTLWPSISGAVIMAVALYGVQRLMAPYALSAIIRLAIQVGAGAIVYAAWLMIFFREKVWRYVRFLRGMRGSEPVPGEQPAQTAAKPVV